MGLTGDFAALEKLQRKMAAMKERAAREMVRSIATFSEGEVRKSFSAQQSPEGEQWAAGSSTSKPMLTKSGKMRAGYVSRISGLDYTLRNKARYAHYHQNGAVLRASLGRRRIGQIVRADGRVISRWARNNALGRKSRGKAAQGPIRKGAERGMLPQRPIMPFADRIPAKWEAGYRERGARVLSRLLSS